MWTRPFRREMILSAGNPLVRKAGEKASLFYLAGYGDKWDRQAYVELLTGLADCGRSLLGDTGVFYMHLDWRGSALGTPGLRPGVWGKGVHE